MGHPQVSFSFRVEPANNLPLIPLCVLVSVMAYAFCFQVPCWMPYSPMGAQPLGLVPLQPFGAYLWQANVHPGDGHWQTLGLHCVAAPSTALSRGAFAT